MAASAVILSPHQLGGGGGGGVPPRDRHKLILLSRSSCRRLLAAMTSFASQGESRTIESIEVEGHENY